MVMKVAINTLYQQKSLSSQQALAINQIFTVDTPTVINGNAVYRTVLFLRLPADAKAQQLILKDFALAATFSASTFNVGSGSGFLKPQGWQKKDGKTIVRLQRAWPIDRINSNSSNAFALYRVDGDSVVNVATISGTTNHSLGGDLVAAEFAVDLFGISRFESTIAIGTSNVSTQALVRKSASSPTAPGGGELISVIDNSVIANFIGLRSVGILGAPTTPRIGILQDALIDAVEAGNYAAGKIDWLSLTPGEHKSGVGVNIVADILPRIQPVVDARRAASTDGSQTVIVPLLFESDAPCCCTLTQFQVSHVLRNTLFGDAQAEKQLRFSGATVDSQQIALTLPRGVVDSVSMAINDAAQDALAVGVSAQTAQRRSSSGAAITAQQAVAARINLPAATVVRGVSIAVNALTATCSIEIALIEDRNGMPSGSVLASKVRQIDGSGQRQFINVPFETPNAELLLDQKPYWLLVRATAGSLLWLATPAAVVQKVLLLKDLKSIAAISAGLQTTKAIPGIQLEFGWILNRTALNAVDVSFSIERQPVALQDDLSAARRYFLHLPPLAQAAADTPVQLSVTRASAGIVSLSALQIDYHAG